MVECVIWYVMLLFFFFFKQKTAYEIYQCDWSSDVCSSDLIIPLIIISFFIPLSGHRYLFPMLPALYILSSLVIVYLWNKARTKYIKAIISLTVLLFVIFSGEFQLTPKTFYALESNRSPIELQEAGKEIKDYYIYTPQPNWEKAYSFIKRNKTPNDIVISVQPVFNKIYLDEAGYWIAYPLSDKAKTPTSDVYVGAQTIQNLNQLKELTNRNHGFIILDFLSLDNRISPEILSYIYERLELMYEDTVNYWSRIWIYRF